ncbi:MAG: SMP-30/gluconolactonase/LRE family protein [Anaerolineae bacterium]|nr:SMP-30/gluconolactonase/LRE family protein [Anaerolineae bacterium]MCA9888243.1 SMP-30/gluconolactonase/LRE family protein [Anaerolineae bacterium]MCA9894483.1 SMP-30/gluconolactonase/LRE family protein [Anaerolineae bacterium]
MSQPSTIERIQAMPGPARVAIYIGGLLLVLVVVLAVTLFVFIATATNQPRTQAAVAPDVGAISEFAKLPDDDAYPSTLAIADDGTLYTASYKTGAIWAITPDGTIREVPNTRERLGAVIALAIGPDGNLYALDHTDPIAIQGGILWHITPDGDIHHSLVLAETDQTNVRFFDDLAVDSDGHVFISERVQDAIWRWEPSTNDIDLWWRELDDSSDMVPSPGGLAYDATTNSVLVADATLNTITRIPTHAESTQSEAEVIYRFSGAKQAAPGFDGLAVTPTGTIYAAALGQNAVMRLDGGEMVTIAQGFRGSSAVAYDPQRNLLYVNNWDQSYLQPQNVFLFLYMDIPPRLPFGIDRIELATQ